MKTIVIETIQCPSCGKSMSAGALAGLCPACLLAQGLGTDVGGGRKAPFVPPPLEEVAKLFPQLEILGLLGAGGMGAVYKARQPALDRIVALKILPSHNEEGANFAERFNREARALARLSHPNIVAVFEFGQAGALGFFIMEFVDGANLRQFEKAGRLSPREALQIIPQICDALQYAHDEGVVHRDIKPENVLVDRKGRVKIADFGLAKILGQDAESLRLTAEGQVMGTPHYMAPEQIEKPLTVDHRADIYSLGVVLYEMLTGDLPLGKFAPPSRKYQLDVRLDDVVLRALENDPARRYQHASEVKTQVENIAATPAPASPPLPESQRTEESPRPVPTTATRPRSLVVVAALFMVAGGLAAWDVGRSLHTQIHSYNLGVFALPVGIGLLRLRPKWRATALLMLWLPLVLAAIAGVMALFGNFHLPPFTRVELFGHTLTGPAGMLCAMAAGVVWFALFVWTNHVLLRSDVAALFQRRGWVRPWTEWAVLAGAILLAFAVSPRNGPPAVSVIGAPNSSPAVSNATPFAPTKTIVLTRATNQMVGESGDVRTVGVWSDNYLQPGEALRVRVKTQEGEMQDTPASLFVQCQQGKVSTSSVFTWFLKGAFGEKEAEAAVAQIRENKTERPITLASRQPVELFSVTNRFGGVMVGYAEFVRTDPPPVKGADGAAVKVRALVRIKDFTGYFPSVNYSAEVPPGYALRATASDGQVSSHTPAGPYEYSSTWFQPFRSRVPLASKPGSLGQDQTPQAAFQAQLQALQDQGPLEVVLGEPRLLFSITNSPGEVCSGFLELVGPNPNATR